MRHEEYYLSADPVAVAGATGTATDSDLNALFLINDKVRELMRIWNTHAASHATAAQLDAVNMKVSKWMSEVSAVRRLTTVDNRPDQAGIIALRKVGFQFETQFRLSLAFLAPLTYAKEYGPLVLAQYLSNPLTWPSITLRNIKETVAVIVGLSWGTLKWVFTGKASPVATVGRVVIAAGQTTGAVIQGVAEGGKRLIGTLDTITNNLTPILLIGLALYFVGPQIAAGFGRGKASVGGGEK